MKSGQTAEVWGTLAPNLRALGGWSGLVTMGLLCAMAGPASAVARSNDESSVSGTPATVQELRLWVLATGDNQGRPFVIVDKLDAQASAFDPAGALVGSVPVLLGVARGDDSPPGIGDRALADIGPEDRITPAGRFVAELGENLSGKTVLWVDYDAAVSLHPVATGKPSERRQARLDSPTPSDNRISYGCINVPAAFFQTVVETLFAVTPGIVYVVPETRSLKAEFFDRASQGHPGPSQGLVGSSN